MCVSPRRGPRGPPPDGNGTAGKVKAGFPLQWNVNPALDRVCAGSVSPAAHQLLGVGAGVGAGVAAGAGAGVAAILASASMARCSAALSFFCSSP